MFMRNAIIVLALGAGTQAQAAGNSFLRTCYNYQQIGHNFAVEMLTANLPQAATERCLSIKENHFFLQQLLAEESNPFQFKDELKDCWYIGALGSALKAVDALPLDCASSEIPTPVPASCDLPLDLDFCQADLSSKDISKVRKKILLNSQDPKACLAAFAEKLTRFVEGDGCEK